jgi:periplasmic protein TonB
LRNVRTDGWTMLTVPRSWRSRAVVVLILITGYATLFYGFAHTRARRTEVVGPPMLAPVISEVGARRGDVVTAKPLPIGPEDESTPPVRHWIFPPIDIWPSASGWSATLSEFTPVTDARADPQDAQAQYQRTGRPANNSKARRSSLRMALWLRPTYPMDLASAGVEGSVVLDLLIDAQGQPVKEVLAQSSGSSELDTATLSAAKFWRFSPPRFKSRPVEVWGRVEVRYKVAVDRKAEGSGVSRE